VDTALLLAGGESARFGRPKALVDVGGKAMVSRVFDAVEPLAGEIVISVGSAQMADDIRSVLSRAKFVVDRRHGLGPVEGMIRGFEIARGTRVLVAPCDAPLLRSDLYRTLLGVMGHHDAAVPKFDVFDPVRAVYRRTAVLRIFAKAKVPLPSPSSLVDRLDAVFVSEDRLRSVDPRLDSFLDVNREEDLAEVLRRLKSA